MVTLIPWWTRVLLSILVIAICVTISALLGLSGVYFLFVFYPLIIAAHIGMEFLRPAGSLGSSGLGLTHHTLGQVSLGMGIALVSILVVAVASLALGARFEAGSGTSPWMWFVGLVLAAAGEEVLFRGTIFEALRERFSPNVAVAVTSILFGLAHANNGGASIVAVINVTSAGVLFGAMVIRTSSLWMSIGYHIAWNLVLYLFIGSVSGNASAGAITHMVTTDIDPALRWIIDGPFGVEQGLVTTIVLIAGIVAVAGWARPDRYVRAAKLRRMRREHELSRNVIP